MKRSSSEKQELRHQSIVVLDASEDGEGDEPSLHRWRPLQIHVGLGNGMSCLRWARAVVEGDKVTHDSPNMILVQENEVIQGVLAECPVGA